jgi:hypothetical protein
MVVAVSAPKEAFYDEKIAPLMGKIIALCKEAKINMVADFSLGYDDETEDTLFCTTAMPRLDPTDEHGMEKMSEAYELLRPNRPMFDAFTITTSKTP